jgi:Lrp/AsnC family transcriptional regulator, leucine-responsive regulatory protein
MKLDAIDRKLLSQMYQGYRNPISKIAKDCRISRDKAEYRIKKYEQSGLIRKYMTVFNYNALGYNEFVVVWLKFLRKDKKRILTVLEKLDNRVSIGDVLGNYSLFLTLVIKDKADLEKTLYGLIRDSEDSIIDYNVFFVSNAELFPLKAFGSKKNVSSYKMVSSEKKIDIDKLDWDIMKILEQNGRTKIVDMSDKLNLSSERLIYRLRKLRKNNIILGNRLLLDMKLIGFYFGIVTLKLIDNLSDTRAKISEFCKRNDYVNAVGFGFGTYNCFIQIMYSHESEFRDTVDNIYTQFEDIISDSNIVLIGNENMPKTLPYK